MNIISDRLILRALEPSDKLLLRKIINDPETEYMLGGWSFPVSEKDQDEWYASLKTNSGTLRCMIADRNDPGKAFGTVMLTDIDYKNGTAEIHIKLATGEARGKGYGAEAVSAMVNYAFNELRLHCIYARVNDYNLPSRKMFEKCGFKKEGILRGRFYKQGKYVDVFSYSVLKEDTH